MSLKLWRWIFCGLLIGGLTAALHSFGGETRAVYSGLVVHEWGTFTSIAGNQGQAVEWSPLIGSTDLPSFVEHLRTPQFKLGLRGTVRMETPVLYFYSPQEEKISVSVHFTDGLITEWYPHASRVEPHQVLAGSGLGQSSKDGSIAWDAVTLAPNLNADFPDDSRASHYYAARQTTSTPLRVSTAAGEQYERFLFYRGVADFRVPITAQVGLSPVSLNSGSQVQVQNHSDTEIPNIILFERRGRNVGYRIGGALRGQVSLDPPELNASVDDLGRELESILIAQGLYSNEAHAMVETWRDSWFEEGSRLLYIVPQNFVNSVLPLTIQPAPTQIERVFVGRMELVTPGTRDAIEQALAAHDDATLAKYGRFLEPILNTILKSEPDAAKLRTVRQGLNAVYSSLLAQSRPNS